MMHSIGYWIVSLHRCYEIAGNYMRALMDELEEGVLPIGARLSPNDWTGGIRHRLGIAFRHRLPIAFHVTLLEISSKSMQILIVRQNGVSACIIEIGIPDAE